MNVKKILTTVDTHTAGGPTRTVIGGVPPLAGKCVVEKMDYFRLQFDAIRKLLIGEPRGHKGMYGAVVTEPALPGADIGAFFFTASGYLPACVHSSIGLATAGLESGFLPRAVRESIKMEVPAGLISLTPRYAGDHVESVALETPPAFVHTACVELELAGTKTIRVGIVFSGVFFVLVDVGQLDIPRASPDAVIGIRNAAALASLGAEILEAANRTVSVQHPQKPEVNTVELVMIYEQLDGAGARDIVINRSGGIDRSPCGAGTGAMVTDLFSKGALEPNQDYLLESFIGTRFIGRVLRPAEVGPFRGAVPEIEGSAYVTGMHQFVLDAHDPLSEGFLF